MTNLDRHWKTLSHLLVEMQKRTCLLNLEKWGRDQEKNRETYMWVWTGNETLQRSRTVNWFPIKNCESMPNQELRVQKREQRIKKRDSERRRFVKRNKSLTLLKESRVFYSTALHDWNCFSLIMFSLFVIVAILHQCIVHIRRLTFMHI